ncbi:hypothetical protein ACQ4LE_005077 [Meloidogyne hapla]|uniref:J domain-containing protein n=1 Tax=Meloidogyne hapla TaxID=6305 RepID=A0A1I8BT78_MELHA
MKVENRNAKISDKEFLKNMKKLSDAHYVLSDKKKRQEYDMELKGKSNLENKRKSAEGESSNRDDQKDEESLGSPQSFRSSHFMGGSGSFFGKGFPFGGTSGKGVTIGGNTHYGTGIQKVGPTDVVGGIPTSGTKITIGGNINSRGSQIKVVELTKVSQLVGLIVFC